MELNGDLFLDAAVSIGARLCRDALWAGPRCNWLGDSMEFINNSWSVAHKSFGPGLYDGTAGIALFLARLYKTTREPLHRKTAEAGARQACSRLGDVPAQARLAYYAGLTGIAHALLTLGETFEDPVWTDQGLRALESMVGDDPAGQGLDVVGGAAGAIPALIDVHRRYGADSLIDLAVRLGDHLIGVARKSDEGLSWDTLKIPAQHDLTGFSHGAAGIAWALLELGEATGEGRFRTASEGGFAFERRWFNPARDNWPDFRNLGDPATATVEPNYSLAWCHGAPGIGLSRLRAFELTGDLTYRAEAEAAIRTTIKALEPSAYVGNGNYSLCHGHAGNADMLIYASRALADPRYKAIADEVGRRGIEQHLRPQTPWPCGVIGGGETPSLLLGLAGIGDFYLRLARPDDYPSLLIIIPSASTHSVGDAPAVA